MAEAEDVPEEVAPPAEGQDIRVRRSKRWTRRYVLPAVLFAIAVVSGVVALLLYPSDNIVHAETALTAMSIDSYVALGSTEVDFYPTDDGASQVVAVHLLSANKFPTMSQVNFPVPTSDWGGANKCAPKATCYVNADGGKFVQVLTGNPKPHGRVWEEDATIYLPGDKYGLAVNTRSAQVELPAVAGHHFSSVKSYTNDSYPVELVMKVPDLDKYAWTQGPEPLLTPNSVAEWNVTTNQPAPLIATAVNTEGQDTSDRDLFISGALLGVAGGALIGAIQEVVRATGQRMD